MPKGVAQRAATICGLAAVTASTDVQVESRCGPDLLLVGFPA
jgi:hypothetical protein